MDHGCNLELSGPELCLSWGTYFLGETLWLRPDLREQVGSAARLIEKGVVCWLHVFRGLLLARPIRMFGEGRAVPAGRTK
jgi:hypothetical protein